VDFTRRRRASGYEVTPFKREFWGKKAWHNQQERRRLSLLCRLVFEGGYALKTKTGSVHVNTLEGFFSVFKRGMIGTYQHVSAEHSTAIPLSLISARIPAKRWALTT